MTDFSTLSDADLLAQYKAAKGTSNPADFAEAYGPAAAKAAAKLGVDPQVLLGQWGLETGWGKSIIPGTNNLGNIKDFSGSGTAATDNMTGSRDKYRAYASPEAFADDYSDLISRKYAGAVGAKTPEQFAAALKAGGYAEDPNYTSKVVKASQMAQPKGIIQRGVEAVIPSANAAETLAKGAFDGMSDADLMAAYQKAKGTPAAPDTSGGAQGSWEADQPGKIASLGAGLGKGVGTVALGAQRVVGKALTGVDSLLGSQRNLSSLITGQPAPNSPLGTAGQWLVNDAEQGRSNLAAENAPYKAANPIANVVGEVGGNIAATLPVGLGLGAVAKGAGATSLGNAIASGGMTTGAKVAPGALNAAANMGTRMLGGAINGGASAGLVDSNSAGTGAAIGAALPPVVKGLGAAGSAIARTIRGPDVPEAVRAAAAAGREAGYVIPPTQAKPTLVNRLLEGMSGKITTAQNASARNQEVTNQLARNAIGAAELSPEGLAAVRGQANQAYEALGKAGAFQTDDAFRSAMEKVGTSSKQLKADFPELVNKDVEALVEGFAGKTSFDAQSAIEAIKRLRATASANKAAFNDPEKLALGRVQTKISAALEDLIDRNLSAQGDTKLLDAYRAARQTLAKTYDVERALNPASGNIDANKLAQALKKGRPLSDELRTIAEFSSSFPKAAQTPERMGSLPQTSPLDWTGAAIATGASGSPLGLLGLVARPAARQMTLSPMVQNRLAQAAGQPLSLGARENLLMPLYRGGPVLSSDR